MNYVYSLFKQLNSAQCSSRSTFYQQRLVVVFIMGYAAFSLFGIPFIIRKIFFIENNIPDYIGALLFGGVIVYPIVHAFIPGYRYIDKVKNYSYFESLMRLVLIMLLPAVIMIVASKIL